jgi:hypothetical protein
LNQPCASGRVCGRLSAAPSGRKSAPALGCVLEVFINLS